MANTFTENLKKSGLDNLENWKGDSRKRFVTMLEPLLDGSSYYIEINTGDKDKKIIDIKDKDRNKRMMGFNATNDGTINAFFNVDFYNMINKEYKLPENRRPNKSQNYAYITLKDVWNILCVAAHKQNEIFN